MAKKKSSSSSSSGVSRDVDKMLIQNFISLQRVLTNLSLKLDNLANQTSKLLELFEISAKNLAKKDFAVDRDNRSSKEIMAKLDYLLSQNKILARGLTLLHEPSSPGFEENQANEFIKPKPLKQNQYQESNEYQKSISSGNKDDTLKSSF